MDMFMLTAVAYVGIVMEILTQLLVLGVGIALINLISAKALELRSEVKRLDYYHNRNKED